MHEIDSLPPELAEDDSPKMTVIDHLDELRTHIIRIVVGIGLCFIVCFIFSRDIINLLKMIAPAGTEFIQIAPGEVFIASLKVSMYSALYLASPIVFYEIFKFCAPGLKYKEKKYAIPVVIAAFLLFTLGIAFSYFAALPLALNFLLGYGSDVATNAISISQYLSFAAAMLLGLGIVFQIPLLITFLALLNIVDSKKLSAAWGYVVLTAFILGAVLTPSPDPFAQTVVAGAIIALYAFSIGLVRIIRK